ncbi:MAG: OmpA family protein [Bacteroidales bacterium]|nr:OmpA family protein [Bacteroidales bacterium]
MKTTFFIKVAFLLMLFPTIILAQEKVRIKKIQFITTEQGSEAAWKAIKKGNKLYNKGPAFYREARVEYLKAYAYNDKNAALNYRIGICYLYADEKNEALQYLKKAFELNNNVSRDIHLQLGRAYHMSLDFDNAVKEYRLFKSSLTPRMLKKIPYNLDQLIEQCETGKMLVAEPKRVVVQNLGKSLNSEYDDFYPVFTAKEDILYFTSRRPSRTNTKRNPLDQKFSEDIYVSKKTSRDWTPPQLLDKRLTSKHNEAVVAASPSGDTLYIYSSKGNGNIYFTCKKENRWSGLHAFRRINTRGSRETSICFSPDGKYLYFVSDAERKGSIGGKDIYYCEKDEDGDWSKPKNMGPLINTPYNEEGVSISPDGKTLYFSSKGHPGMGGYDIFYSTKTESGWSKPVNMGYPINTPDDDLFYVALSNGKIAYLSSNREQSVGGKDIYKVVYLGAAKEFINLGEPSPLAYELYDKPTMNRVAISMLTVDSSLVLMGRVLDSETQKGLMAKIQFIDSEKSKVVATLLSDSLGNYKTQLPERKALGVEINTRGYLLYLGVVDLTKEKSDIIQKDFLLQPLSVGAKVVLKNIFFETGKAILKEESFQQLNNVITFLKENPTLRLEISGHTDNVGGLAYNIRLSEARAKAVVTYLVENGIEKGRLTYKGYGPHQPVASNKTADGRAQNRRVEFKITGM